MALSTSLTAKGYIYPPEAGYGGSCGGCAGDAVSVAPFEIGFRGAGCGGESYLQARSGASQVRTGPTEWVPLPLTQEFSSIQLLAVRTSAPITLRLRGTGARAVTAASFPTAMLVGQALAFTLDAVGIAMTFASGEDTASEVAARINASAALAGLTYYPASVTSGGQVAIEGALTGPTGALSAFTGAAAATLGLGAFVGAQGGGSDIQVDGLFVAQFPRPGDLTRVEVNGTASVSVLAAGT
jgi:hypothetical protein